MAMWGEPTLRATVPASAPHSILSPCLLQPALKQFKIGLALFLRRTFGPWLAAKQPGPSSGLSDAQLAALLSRLQAAEKALGTSVVA